MVDITKFPEYRFPIQMESVEQMLYLTAVAVAAKYDTDKCREQIAKFREIVALNGHYALKEEKL